MNRPPRKALAAIAASALLFLTMLVATTLAASPAQAVGWSGQRCDNTVEGVHVCVQIHTVNPGSTSYTVDAVQVCATMNRANNHVRGITRGTVLLPGNPWRYDLPYVAKGSCGYAYPNYRTSNGCWSAKGDVDLSVYPDNDHWSVGGRILGGAC